MQTRLAGGLFPLSHQQADTLPDCFQLFRRDCPFQLRFPDTPVKAPHLEGSKNPLVLRSALCFHFPCVDWSMDHEAGGIF
jgi:hypothetical protein